MLTKIKQIKNAIKELLESKNIEKPIIYLIAFLAIASVTAKLFIDDSGRYKTDVYSVKYPEDWSFDDSKSKTIVLGSKELDGLTGKPIAIIRVYTEELPRAMWIADEFPFILQDIKRKGYEVIDVGEIKLSENLSKWVLFKDQGKRTLKLHIYTIDSFNNFIQLEYTTTPEKFATYRPIFEKMKDSFLLRKPLFEI